MSSRVLKRGWQAEAAAEPWLPPAGAAAPPDPPEPAAPPVDIEAVRAEACQQGRREGEAAARAALQPLVERLAGTIGQIAGLRARMRREAEADMVKLSIAIARRILHREISVDPEALMGLVKVALEKLEAQEIHRVRVHPDLEPLLRRMLEQSPAGGRVQVIAERGLQPGDVVFEGARGSLDASVETQLEEISRGLADRLRARS